MRLSKLLQYAFSKTLDLSGYLSGGRLFFVAKEFIRRVFLVRIWTLRKSSGTIFQFILAAMARSDTFGP